MPLQHVIIHGRVQGVGFRHWMSIMAGEVGLTGWVRNRSDQTVEAFFSGSEEQLEKALKFCYEGPELASVTSIDKLPLEDDIELSDDFVILPTVMV